MLRCCSAVMLQVVFYAGVLTACPPQRPIAWVAPPNVHGAELYVFLRALRPQCERLSFQIDALGALSVDGTQSPLKVVGGTVSAADPASGRFIAVGYLPPGSYSGLSLKTSAPRKKGGDGYIDLLAPDGPTGLRAAFDVDRRQARVLSLDLDCDESVTAAQSFLPVFSAEVDANSVPQRHVYVSTPSADTVFAFDKHTYEALGALPVGREPRAVVVDGAAGHAFVALGGDDAIDVIDTSDSVVVQRIALMAGDAPVDLALIPDARGLLTVNSGSSTVSWIDLDAGVEVERVLVGERPLSLTLDRSGRRAYVVNTQSDSVTVVDVERRLRLSTIATEPHPLRAALSHDEQALFVVHKHSAIMLRVSVPSMQIEERIFLGAAASAVKVDPASGLVYVAMGSDSLLHIYDAASNLPLDSVKVDGPVAHMAIDNTTNRMFLSYERRAEVGVLDLGQREIIARLPGLGRSNRIAMAGERR